MTRLILVVEDNQDDADLIFRACRSISPEIKIVHAKTGLEAIDLFGGQATDFYDLVLLDSKLPGKSGLEVLEALKEKDPEGSTPIVFFSSSVEPRFMETVLRLGASACAEKPTDYETFMLTVQDIVSTWAAVPTPNVSSLPNSQAESLPRPEPEALP